MDEISDVRGEGVGEMGKREGGDDSSGRKKCSVRFVRQGRSAGDYI